MRDIAARIVNALKRGGGMPAPLFFACSLLAATCSVWIGTIAALSADTLLAFVPKNAVAYIHASGAQATSRILTDRTHAFADAAPDEVAMYSDRNTDGGALRWTTLLGWHDAAKLSDEALGAAGAMRLAEGIYAYGYSVEPGDETLADDLAVRDALHFARDRARIQAYVADRVFESVMDNGDRYVIAITSDGPLMRGVGFSLDTPRVPHAKKIAPGFAFWTVKDATLSVSAAVPNYSPFDLLFAGTLNPDTRSAAVDAEMILADLMRSPVAASIITDAVRGAPGVVLHYPTVAPNILTDAMERFVGTAWAIKRPLVLPDRMRTTELFADQSRSSFGPSDDLGVSHMDAGPGRSLYIRDDGRGGALVGNAVSPLLDARPSKGLVPQGCHTKGVQVLTLAPGDVLIESFPLISTLTWAQISLSVDNLVYFCGYWDKKVDK